MVEGLSLQKSAKRLCIYIGESDRWEGKTLDSELLGLMRKHGMAGATVFRGIAGFGAHSRIRSARIEVLSFDLPVMIEVIDSPEKIKNMIEIIYPMVREGLITVEDVEIVKYSHRFVNTLPADKLVNEVMTKEVLSLKPDMTVREAWKQLLENQLKANPVVDVDGKVIGMLTDQDLLERAGIQQRLSVAIRMDAAEISQELQGLEKSPLKVADVMTKPVITADEQETLGSATERMVKSGLKRMPVTNSKGLLVGMLSRLDILRQVADNDLTFHTVPLITGPIKNIQDAMMVDIPTIGENDDLATIINKFSMTDSHRLIVVDSSGKAVGLISDSDVVARVQPRKRRSILNALRHLGEPPAGKETAFDLMSPGPLTAHPDTTVVEAINRMLSESRKWMVVINDQGIPMGLVDRKILLEALVPVSHDE
jgi:CBS domain-containing protein